jgi:hypothetical protein
MRIWPKGKNKLSRDLKKLYLRYSKSEKIKQNKTDRCLSAVIIVRLEQNR